MQTDHASASINAGSMGTEESKKAVGAVTRENEVETEEKVSEKQVIYYSDFDISYNDWRSEYEYISIYGVMLQQLLTDPWKHGLNSILAKQNDSGTISSKDPFEVALEYLLLANRSDKDIAKIADELISYYNFFGYTVLSNTMFVALVPELLEKFREVDGIVMRYKDLDRTCELSQKEAACRNMKPPSKEQESEFSALKQKPKRFMINHRVVCPMFVALEKTFAKSVQELHKIDSSPCDLFPLCVIKAVFTYIDYEAIRAFSNSRSHFFVFGCFATVVIEVNSSELRNIHEKMGQTMSTGEMYVRVMKPHKDYYNTLLEVLLKFGLHHAAGVSMADLLEAAAHRLQPIWRPELRGTTEAFYGWCKAILAQRPQCSGEEFLENLKCQMLKKWEYGVVFKSGSFRRATIRKETSSTLSAHT